MTANELHRNGKETVKPVKKLFPASSSKLKRFKNGKNRLKAAFPQLEGQDDPNNDFHKRETNVLS
jgi:hypothetical protein